MSTPVLITIPKIVAASSPVFKDYIECKTEAAKGRKRRLDHLSWEEKLQRKKLKNRVAAQTSRDRKKQKMEEMEITIQDLVDQNQLLINEVEHLRNLNATLQSEKESLSSCRCHCSTSSSTPSPSLQSSPVDCAPPRSAVSAPPPQGGRAQSAAALEKRRMVTHLVLRMLLACLAGTTETCSTLSSMTPSLRSSLKACSRISPATWRRRLHKNRLQQIVKTKITQEKWWGRHQNNWNPVETSA